MKFIAAALLTLLSNASTTNASEGKAGKGNGKSQKSNACSPETIQGLWQCKHQLLLLRSVSSFFYFSFAYS